MTRFPFGPAAMATLALGLSAQDDAGAGAVAAELAPHAGFVTRYCRDCHGGDLVRAELDLTATQSDPVERLFRLSRLRERVRAGEMPPPDADAPPPAERDAFVAWVDGELRREVPALPPASGRVTVRRLNSAQWRRTVHDLFGVEVATAGFPADDLGYGFDTVGDAMTFSTLHLEKYLAAAGEVAALVFAGEDPEHPAVRRFEGEAMRVARGGGVDQDGDLAVLTTRALLEQTVELPRDGTYRLRIVAGAS
ncbi:MAG: DUF1587 domain-containing protein, partial [Planctomycetes bacterium]|nr:DUF1587 domain-containing protein [Planctomycetota bacterium]